MIYYRVINLVLTHCVKSVRIRSFSGPYFPAKEGPEKLRIRTLFTESQRLLKTLMTLFIKKKVMWGFDKSL